MELLTCARCGGLTPPDAAIHCLHCDAPLADPAEWAGSERPSGPVVPAERSRPNPASPNPARPNPAKPNQTSKARYLRGLLGPAGAILLAACYGGPGRYYGVHEPLGPPGTTRLDRDHDGVLGPYECVGGQTDCAERLAGLPRPADLDCDDANPAVFPGGADVDGDGVDGNCDGVDGWADPAQVAVPPAQPASSPASSPPAQVAVPPAP